MDECYPILVSNQVITFFHSFMVTLYTNKIETRTTLSVETLGSTSKPNPFLNPTMNESIKFNQWIKYVFPKQDTRHIKNTKSVVWVLLIWSCIFSNEYNSQLEKIPPEALYGNRFDATMKKCVFNKRCNFNDENVNELAVDYVSLVKRTNYTISI